MRELQLYPGNRTVSQKALTVIEGMQLLVELYSEYEICIRNDMDSGYTRGLHSDFECKSLWSEPAVS